MTSNVRCTRQFFCRLRRSTFNSTRPQSILSGLDCDDMALSGIANVKTTSSPMYLYTKITYFLNVCYYIAYKQMYITTLKLAHSFLTAKLLKKSNRSPSLVKYENSSSPFTTWCRYGSRRGQSIKESRRRPEIHWWRVCVVWFLMGAALRHHTEKLNATIRSDAHAMWTLSPSLSK